MDHPRISIDPKVMVGKPCIKGTRIPVDLILRKLAAGDTIQQIQDSYERLTREDIVAAIAFAAETVNNRKAVAAE